ncbi:MAG: hypothetical protein ACYTF9_10120 [Planctomycetota bacterium]|jgi:hypothetical protein
MRRIASSILILLIGLQGILSPFAASGLVLCLGTDESGQAPLQEEVCPHGCSHAPVSAAPVVEDEHGGCCTDVELVIAELLGLTRGGAHGEFAIVAPVMITIETVDPSTPLVVARRELLRDDPGARHRLRVVRSTRLLV